MKKTFLVLPWKRKQLYFFHGVYKHGFCDPITYCIEKGCCIYGNMKPGAALHDQISSPSSLMSEL